MVHAEDEGNFEDGALQLHTAMRDLDDLFAALPKSRFRSSFSLKSRECDYLATKGRETVAGHARDFVAQRLAPAVPHNDGRQTPFADAGRAGARRGRDHALAGRAGGEGSRGAAA